MKQPVSQLAVLLLLAGCLGGMASCGPSSVNSTAEDCPPCPNNTECLAGDCGCRSDKYDMGSWCLQKSDNLFVAASLDCHCLDVVGLILGKIDPEPVGSGALNSGYSLIGRGNCQGAAYSNFSYFSLPDGDSIVVYGVEMASQGNNYTCRINDDLRCGANLYGKFHGPDTIKTQVRWNSCCNNAGEWVNYSETSHLTFVRWK